MWYSSSVTCSILHTCTPRSASPSHSLQPTLSLALFCAVTSCAGMKTVLGACFTRLVWLVGRRRCADPVSLVFGVRLVLYSVRNSWVDMFSICTSASAATIGVHAFSLPTGTSGWCSCDAHLMPTIVTVGEEQVQRLVVQRKMHRAAAVRLAAHLPSLTVLLFVQLRNTHVMAQMHRLVQQASQDS
mmetsp:Transcript_55689/g.130497  ORF Transcript_55689/g.130497 Transcript_55689/m.130497 type:complete len:186 (-) Transcript_55689:350-907(-)